MSHNDDDDDDDERVTIKANCPMVKPHVGKTTVNRFNTLIRTEYGILNK